jgi:hypothetical protein
VKLGIVIALAASALALGSPAEAKGMSGVTITGAGLGHPIVLDVRTDAAALERLMVTAPMFGDATGGSAPDGLADLGLPLRLTWTVGWKTTQHVVQVVYPYAPRGPVFHTLSGQPIFDQLTADEWYQTGPRTLAVLQSVGVPAPGELRAARAVLAFVQPWITAGQAILRW